MTNQRYSKDEVLLALTQSKGDSTLALKVLEMKERVREEREREREMYREQGFLDG